MAAGIMAFLLGFIALVSLQHATAEKVHVVGDTTGWTVPSAPTFYSDWAAKNKFAVGDSLKFNFATFTHDVQKVTKASFESCSTDDAIGSPLTTGPATVKLDAAGEHYFICTVGKHCLGGQKLSVTVGSASAPGGALPPSSNNTSDQPPVEAPPAATTPANSPSSSTPSGGGSSAAPAPSSSTAVMATLYVTLSAIVMSLLF